MISNEYGDVRKVQVRITAELEYLHNYGWIQSDWAGCVGRISTVLQSSPLLSSPYFLTARPVLPSSPPQHNIQITEDQLSVSSLLHLSWRE